MMRAETNFSSEAVDHTPTQLMEAMAGYRFSMRALLAEMFRENSGGLGRETIARRAEDAAFRVIQDFRNQDTDIPVYFDENTEPFPLVSKSEEGIWVEFSPEAPMALSSETREAFAQMIRATIRHDPPPPPQPRPAIAPWDELLGRKKAEKDSAPESEEDDVFAGLDSLDDFMVGPPATDTEATTASAEETLVGLGDMRVMSEPEEAEETAPLPTDKLEQLREASERTPTMLGTSGSSPVLEVRYPESLGEAVLLYADTAGFTDRISVKEVPDTIVTAEVTPDENILTLSEPLQLDQEEFEHCFPPNGQDISY